MQQLKNKNPGPPSHAGNPKPGWGQQFNRHYMAQHNVVDYTKQYDNLLMSYGEHSQIQRYTYGLDLTSMDFIALDDHDNGWIPSGTETAYVDQWDTLYYLHDDLGTVNKVIGSSGKTSAHYNYDEFGRPLGAVKLDPNWSGPDNAIAYTGYTYDHFAELYYAQARYYQPEAGRFISQDPWAGNLTQPGTLNPYPYVLNNPLGYVDPLGLWIDCDQLKAVLETPDKRIQWVNNFFINHTRKLTVFGKVVLETNYGVDVVKFMEWERDSGRIGNIDNGSGGSFYWKAANGMMIADMMEAENLVNNNSEQLAIGPTKEWTKFINDPSQSSLWMAHNTSIINATRILYNAGAMAKETPSEQAFIHSVVFRVTGTQTVNFPSSMGLISLLMREDSPLGYPGHYPATWEDDATYPNWGIMPGEKEEWRSLFEN